MEIANFFYCITPEGGKILSLNQCLGAPRPLNGSIRSYLAQLMDLDLVGGSDPSGGSFWPWLKVFTTWLTRT